MGEIVICHFCGKEILGATARLGGDNEWYCDVDHSYLGIQRDTFPNRPQGRYGHIPVDDPTRELMEEFRQRFFVLEQRITQLVPNSRGRSLTFTHLEIAAFYLNKAITNNDQP